MTFILIASAMAIAITIPIFLSLHRSRIPGVLTFAASAMVASVHIAWRASGGPVPHPFLDVLIPSFMLLGCLLMLSGFRQFVGKPALRPLTLLSILVPIVGLLAVFTFVQDSYVGRTIVSTGAASVIFAGIAWTMARRWHEADAPEVFIVFATICAITASAFFMSRWITVVVGIDSSSYFVEPTPWNTTVSSIRLLMFPSIYFSAILLVLGRTVTRLERALIHDDLTGALSRGPFLATAAPHFGQGRADQAALLFLDLDRFKQLNDGYGHGIGDQALKHFVQVTSKVLPPRARIGRLGGEEFAILLPESTELEAVSIGESVMNALRETPLAHEGLSIPMTTSIGLATGRTGDSLDHVLKRSDRALYQAKANGRDQLCIADEAASNAPDRSNIINPGERRNQRAWMKARPFLSSVLVDDQDGHRGKRKLA